MKMIAALLYAGLLAGLARAQADADLYEEKLFLRDKDLLRYNLDKYLNFEATSINFRSNNKLVELPGLNSKTATTHATETAFDPLLLKARDNHVFVLEKDGRTLREFTVEGLDKVALVDSELARRVAALDGFFCSDLLFLADNSVCALCYNEEQHRSKREGREFRYVLLSVNYFLRRLNFQVEFRTVWMNSPVFKLLTARQQDGLNLNFLVFDKELREAKPQPQKQATLVSLGPVAQQTRALLDAREFAVDVTLFGKPTALALENVMVTTGDKRLAFFLVRYVADGAEEKVVAQQCDLVYSESIAALGFSNCQTYKTDIKVFFSKETNYVLLTNKDWLMFCDMERASNCSRGKIPNEWAVDRIILEEDIGVAVIRIRNTSRIFIKNFRENSFTWHYVSNLNTEQTFLVKVFKAATAENYLLTFLDKGFSLTDITVNKMLTIRPTSLAEAEKIDLFLDDMRIFALELVPYNDERIVDLAPAQKTPLVKSFDGYFKAKLPIAGSNMHFKSEPGKYVYYYSGFDLHLDVLEKAMFPFSVDGKIFVYYEDGVHVFNCVYKLFNYEGKCADRKFVELPRLDPRKIVKIERVADYHVLLFEKSEDLLVFDSFALKHVPMKLDPDFAGGRRCKVDMRYLLCQYRVEGEQPVDVVRVFELAEGQLVHLKQMGEQMLQWARELIAASQAATPITAVEIADFGHDSVRAHNLIVLFTLATGATYRMSVDRFKLDFARPALEHKEYMKEIAENADLKQTARMLVLDNQTCFANDDPVFVVYCHDLDSLYKLFYVRTNQIVRSIELPSHNLVAIVYRRHDSQQINMIIYRITRNAVHQTLADVQLADEVDAQRLQLLALDAYTVLVADYNNAGKVNFSVIYLDGPFVVASSLPDAVEVNGQRVPLNFVEDKTFNQFSAYFLKSTSVDTDRVSQFRLEDYISLQGNIREIQSDSPDVKVTAPLELLDKEKPLGPMTALSDPVVAVSDRKLVYETAEPGKFVVTDGKDSAAFSLAGLGGRRCSEAAFVPGAFLCFWQSGPRSMLSFKQLKDGAQEDYQLSRPGFMAKVIQSSDILTFSQVSVDHKFLTINSIDRLAKKVKTLYIGKKKLRADSLKVTDYHLAIDSTNKFITALIFDKVANRLHLFHSDASLNILPTLKKSVDLGAFGLFFRNVTCTDSDKSLSTLAFRCNLYSDAAFFSISIQRVAGVAVSEYNWHVESRGAYKNVLFSDSFSSTFQLDDAVSDRMTVLRNANPAPGLNRLVCYETSIVSPYSHFTLSLPDELRVLAMLFDADAARLLVFARRADQLVLLTYAVGEYRIRLLNPAALAGTEANLAVYFHNPQSQPQKLKFSFFNEQSQALDSDSAIGFLGYLLIALIVIVSLLILLSLGAIAYFYKNRKRDMLANPEAV